MRYATAILILVLIATSPSCKYFKGGLFGRKAKQIAMMKAREDSIRIADSLQKISELKLMEQARIDSARNAEAQRLAYESKFRYNIIVGSFITPEYAKDLSEVYRKQGYEPNILKPSDSKFELVAIEAYDNFSKAASRLKLFQDTVQLDSWMYIRK